MASRLVTSVLIIISFVFHNVECVAAPVRTSTPTRSPSPSLSNSSTFSRSPSPSLSNSSTFSRSPTGAVSASFSRSFDDTESRSASVSWTFTLSEEPLATATPSKEPTSTKTASQSQRGSSTRTYTLTLDTGTEDSTVSQTTTRFSASPQLKFTSRTETYTGTQTLTAFESPTWNKTTWTASPSRSRSVPSTSPSATGSRNREVLRSRTVTWTYTDEMTSTSTDSMSLYPSVTPMKSLSAMTLQMSVTTTRTEEMSMSSTSSPTRSQNTAESTGTVTITPPPTPSASHEVTRSNSITASGSQEVSSTETWTPSRTRRSATRTHSSLLSDTPNITSVTMTLTTTVTITPPPTPTSTLSRSIQRHNTTTRTETVSVLLLTASESSSGEATITKTKTLTEETSVSRSQSKNTKEETSTRTSSQSNSKGSATLTQHVVPNAEAVTTSNHILRLSGDSWNNLLKNDTEKVKTSVQRDIAHNIGVNESQVNVLSVSYGSLIVYFTVSRRADQEIADEVINKYLVNGSFPQTVSQYVTAGYNDSVLPLYVGTNPSMEEPKNPCGNGCVLAVTIVIGALIVIASGGLCVWWLRKWYHKRRQRLKLRQKVRKYRSKFGFDPPGWFMADQLNITTEDGIPMPELDAISSPSSNSYYSSTSSSSSSSDDEIEALDKEPNADNAHEPIAPTDVVSNPIHNAFEEKDYYITPRLGAVERVDDGTGYAAVKVVDAAAARLPLTTEAVKEISPSMDSDTMEIGEVSEVIRGASDECNDSTHMEEIFEPVVTKADPDEFIDYYNDQLPTTATSGPVTFTHMPDDIEVSDVSELAEIADKKDISPVQVDDVPDGVPLPSPRGDANNEEVAFVTLIGEESTPRNTGDEGITADVMQAWDRAQTPPLTPGQTPRKHRKDLERERRMKSLIDEEIEFAEIITARRSVSNETSPEVKQQAVIKPLPAAVAAAPQRSGIAQSYLDVEFGVMEESIYFPAGLPSDSEESPRRQWPVDVVSVPESTVTIKKSRAEQIAAVLEDAHLSPRPAAPPQLAGSFVPSFRSPVMETPPVSRRDTVPPPPAVTPAVVAPPSPAASVVSSTAEALSSPAPLARVAPSAELKLTPPPIIRLPQTIRPPTTRVQPKPPAPPPQVVAAQIAPYDDSQVFDVASPPQRTPQESLSDGIASPSMSDDVSTHGSSDAASREGETVRRRKSKRPKSRDGSQKKERSSRRKRPPVGEDDLVAIVTVDPEFFEDEERSSLLSPKPTSLKPSVSFRLGN